MRLRPGRPASRAGRTPTPDATTLRPGDTAARSGRRIRLLRRAPAAAATGPVTVGPPTDGVGPAGDPPTGSGATGGPAPDGAVATHAPAGETRAAVAVSADGAVAEPSEGVTAESDAARRDAGPATASRAAGGAAPSPFAGRWLGLRGAAFGHVVLGEVVSDPSGPDRRPADDTGRQHHAPGAAPGGETAAPGRGDPPGHPAATSAAERPARQKPVLTMADLTISFATPDGEVTAARGVSFDVHPGEVLAVVGESGSGKSVTSLAVLGLLPKGARVGGSIRFRGQELLGLDEGALARYRGSRVAMVFQDPMTSLNPVYPVGRQIAEALTAHQGIGRKEAAAAAVELLRQVGIPQPERRAREYPHEFSGGMRQRVVIAIAMANDPDVIVADEPTTALDVTVQAQVLDVLAAARRRTKAAMVLITHDLGVVAGQADRVLVMYAGRPVEVGDVHAVFGAPRMPYTLGLLGSLPRIDAEAGSRLVPIDGAPPAMINLPAGCPFAPRCPLATPVCHRVEPALRPVGPHDHQAACHHTGHLSGAAPADVFGPTARIGPPPEDPNAPILGTVAPSGLAHVSAVSDP